MPSWSRQGTDWLTVLWWCGLDRRLVHELRLVSLVARRRRRQRWLLSKDHVRVHALAFGDVRVVLAGGLDDGLV